MVKRNQNLAKLHSGYLFPEIHKRKMAFLEQNPEANIISLGIGDTTEPIPSFIALKMQQKAESLSTNQGYSGYGAEPGILAFRLQISRVLYQGKFSPDEVFVSDGSKCDIGRIQLMFGPACTMAVQDPTYPAYVDTSVVVGQTGNYQAGQYAGIVYMDCKPENDFFPDFNKVSRSDLIYFCSPNNPTGAAATRSQLEQLVKFAKRNRSILIYDAAYAAYIRDAQYPASIYEIPGADEVAIELGSFSKMAGFTGVRLGWTIIPEKLCYENGESVRKDWHRINTTFFNGASNIAQAGGMAALEPEGVQSIQQQTDFYLENARLIKEAFNSLGYSVYGGTQAPYLWVHFPGKKSWDIFEELLNEVHIVSTPGIGFGPCGEEFLRFSAFGHREKILEAVGRLHTHLSALN